MNEELDGMGFDAAALNAGLNADTEKVDPYAEQESEEEEVEEQETSEESDEEGEEEKPAPRQATKEESRYQKLANERKAERKEKQEEREQRLLAEQRAQLLEQQIAELRRGQQATVDDNLDPLEKWQRDANLQLQRSQFQNQDMLDRTQFLLKVTQKPSLSPYAEQVEKRLHDIRLKGGNPSRDQVLTVIIGEQAMKRMDEAPAIKREAAARVKAATGKPLGTKSNVAPSKSESSEYERLKDIPL